MICVVMNNELIFIIEMVVGDGGGNNINFDGMQGLVNEVYCVLLNRLVIVDLDRNVIWVEMLMMFQVGGWWLCEVVLFDDRGICLVVVSLFLFYKLLLE